MPTIQIPKKALESYIGKSLPEEKLKDRISYLGTDLEGIEDGIITVEVFPNRPDLLSVPGFARSLSSFMGIKKGLRHYTLKKSGCKVIVDRSVSMRPYTCCAIVKNLHFTDERIKEAMQIQEKLATTHGRNRKKSAYGIYPLKPISFPIRYIAKDPREVMFRPLGFDKPIKASMVDQIHPKGKEYRHIGEKWAKHPFFIDDKDNVMCMVPYTNSDDTGKIDESTREVFIECTGTDFQNASYALNILVTALADMGGEIYSIDVQYPDKTITTPNLNPQEMDLDLEYINRRLGLSLSKKEAQDCLERMGHGMKANKVLIPPYRTDIMHQSDLVEDIAIAYGFERFEEIIPKVATVAQESPREIFKAKAAELLVGLGFQEASTYHLASEESQASLMNDIPKPIKLANAISQDYSVLRSWILPGLLELSRHNTHYEYPQRVFAIGSVFHKDIKEDTGVGEEFNLGIISSHEKADYTEARQIAQYLLESFGIGHDAFTIEEHDHPSFILGRCAKIILDGHQIAIMGEIAPIVLKNWSLEMPISAIEMNLEKLYNILSEKK